MACFLRVLFYFTCTLYQCRVYYACAISSLLLVLSHLGATLDAHPVADEGLKINGSVMLALAESKEEVLEQIKNDVYCKEGIWDMDKIQVIPVSRPVALQFDYKKLLEKVLMICE